MPYSDYSPELMGHAVLEPAGPFEAGSWQSLTLTYTAGRFGIDDTGSVKIGFRFATDFGPVQFDDPQAPGYTTVEASNGAELDLSWEFKRNIRPWSRLLYIGVKKHFLAEGDTITIRFGDPRAGSPGVRMQTYCEHDFTFAVFVDAIATYDYVPLPQSPTIALVPGPPVTWRAALPTLVRHGAPFRLSVKADDAWGNPSNQVARHLRFETSHPVAGLPDVAAFEPGSFALVLENLSAAPCDDLTIRVCDEAGTELCVTNPLRILTPEQSDGALVHYWGDLHGQSNETLGTNTARDYFEFGRDRAFLDVCAHQGNDFQITSEFWEDLNALTAELEAPGRFIAIPGYEWSANTAVGGDRNVFFRHEGRQIHRSSHAQVPDMSDAQSDAHDAHALFEALRGEDCVVWAHCGGRYADIKFAHDGRLETAVEVHSSWGTFEWLLHDAFEKGYRVGVVCNSDGHKGRVGASYPGSSFFGAYGGLTCFLAPELTRDAIFAAMRQRRHYGTTGCRMSVDVRVPLPNGGTVFARDPAVFPDADATPADELLMGDIARVTDDTVEVVVAVVGSAPIERIDIFDGTDLIDTVRPYDEGHLGDRVRLTYEGAEYRGRSRTSVWDGALSLTAARCHDARMFNNWNLDRGLHDVTASGLSWKAVTTGNYGGIDLWLDGLAGDLVFETPHVDGRVALKDLGVEPQRFDGGGLGRAVSLQRLPEVPHVKSLRVHRSVRRRAQGDTRLYIRVQQVDGHRAWTSPIYLAAG
ncbi:MAG: DUF3604 domain-containing protein [Pseudomonadota bacterium]